jgi:hypothetical protein
LSSKKFSRKEAESLLGTLVHCLLALPNGCSYLSAIPGFVTSFNHSSSAFICKSPNPSVLSDIEWWCTQLSTDFCGSYLTKPPPLSSVNFWVDVSSSWGIGVVFRCEWDSWVLLLGWDKDDHNIGWAKIVAIELGLLFAVYNDFSDVHFLIKSDNQGVIHAIKGGKSRSLQQNLILQWITLLLSHHKWWISSLYVSLDNVANLPSRGLPPPYYLCTGTTFILPDSLLPFLAHAPDIT